MQVNVTLNKDLMRQIIVNSYGRPHELSIDILDEILRHHSFELKDDVLHMVSDEGWLVNYKYFIDKYGFLYPKIRYAMRKLSSYNLIDRKMIMRGGGGSGINLKIIFENIKDFISI